VRIALFTHGIRGDVWPFISLCHHLRERDYDVTLAAPPNYAALVRAAGVRYGTLPLDTEAFLASDEGRHLTAVGGLRMVRALQAAYAAQASAFDDAFLEASEGAEALVAMHVTMERAQVIAEYRPPPAGDGGRSPSHPPASSPRPSSKDASSRHGVCAGPATISFSASGRRARPGRRRRCAAASACRAPVRPPSTVTAIRTRSV
jgi:hypothetical protein